MKLSFRLDEVDEVVKDFDGFLARFDDYYELARDTEEWCSLNLSNLSGFDEAAQGRVIANFRKASAALVDLEAEREALLLASNMPAVSAKAFLTFLADGLRPLEALVATNAVFERTC